MPTYIVLVRFTQKGMENIKDSPNRLEAARKLGKSLGGKITAAYYTMGQYDMVVILEAPSNEAVMEGLLKTGSLGNVKTETLVAIPAAKGIEIFGIAFTT
ncbi:MAG: GYD domain-containing protein [Candidatus Bathyarchaeota archaeon]|nr:MAG: GYD domain-containing protein [Candidatus Bathyarchaeota archaeon]